MENLKLIDDFIEGKLSGESLAHFELQMREDEDFKKVVDDYVFIQKTADGILEFELSDEINKGIEAGPISEEVNESKHVRSTNNLSRNGFIILLVCASLLAVWLMNKTEVKKIPSTDEITNTDQLKEAVDDDPAKKLIDGKSIVDPPTNINTQNTNQTPMATTGQLGKQLFTEHFTPFRHPSLEPALRGSSTKAPRRQFETAYWEMKYRKVTELWKSLADVEKTNPKLKFLYANALLAIDQTHEAITFLESASSIKNKKYEKYEIWYLAIAYLNTGQTEKANNLLLNIQKNKTHPHQKEADVIVKRLQNK